MTLPNLLLIGLRDVDLTAVDTGTGAELRIEHMHGTTTIELHDDDLHKLTAWIRHRSHVGGLGDPSRACGLRICALGHGHDGACSA